MTRHVVFGTGQVGHPLVEQLVAQGHDVVAVNRDGRGHFPGAQVVGGDATDPAFTTAVCQGADVVYFCLNAMNYERWTEEFPPLQRGVLAGAASAGARLVVLDNLYAYGPPNGQRLVETMAANPTSAKSATRAAMTEELLAAHAAGQVEVVIGRASDYFGPGATRSALGETVFGTALAGKAAQVMGDPDQPHSYSYTPDVAAGLITLGTAPGTSPGRSGTSPSRRRGRIRQIVEAVYELAGHKPKIMAAGRTTLRVIGLFKPEMREYLHTLYQFTDPWVVDDGKFRAAFGDLSTPLDDALATTLAWYARPRRRTRPLTDPADQEHAMNAVDHTPDATTARKAAAALALASTLAIAGFTFLGSIFEYPQILEEPTSDILALFREHQGAVMFWFGVLVLSAALMAPAGIWLGRIAGGNLGRWIAGVGIAAATVQVIGLQRWVTLVPGISDDALDPAQRADAEDRFELLHTLLGKVIGETAGLRPDRDVHRPGGRCAAPLGASRLARRRRGRLRGPHRNRRGDTRLRAREPDELHRLRRLVPLAPRRRGLPPAGAEPCTVRNHFLTRSSRARMRLGAPDQATSATQIASRADGPSAVWGDGRTVDERLQRVGDGARSRSADTSLHL